MKVRFSEVNLNVGSIPAGNDLCDFTCLRLSGNVRVSVLRLIRSLPLAHPTGFVYVARLPSAPFPPGTIYVILPV
jgi:hypothetical protein